jgi:hypothetical protein
MTYPPAPTTFEDLIKLIPTHGSLSIYRFVLAVGPFELRIGRTSVNVVSLSFCLPDDLTRFWLCIRTSQSLTSLRAIWSRWQKFIQDSDSYLMAQLRNSKGPAIAEPLL